MYVLTTKADGEQLCCKEGSWLWFGPVEKGNLMVRWVVCVCVKNQGEGRAMCAPTCITKAKQGGVSIW